MDKITILDILPTCPYPVRAGGSMAIFSMLDKLRHHVNLHVLSIVSEDVMKNLTDLQELWPDVTFHLYHMKMNKELFIQKSSLRLYSNAILRSKAISAWIIPFMRYDNKLLNYISNLIDDINPDIIQTEFYQLQDLVYCLPKSIKKIFIQHEIHYVVNKMWIESHNLKKDIYAQATYNMLKSQEIASMNAYDAILTLNDADKNKLINDGVSSNIFSSPVGVIDAAHRNACTFRGKLVFIGSGGHYPNEEGLKWFISKIWPKVKNANPNLELHIIGNWLESQKKPYSQDYSIIFEGFVEDLTKAFDGAITIVPILSGSGIRMKILDCVNYGSPFVSTTVGALGMGFNDGKDCFIADTPEDFASKIITLIKDKNLFANFYVKSYEVYKSLYSSEALALKRLNIYIDILKNK